jgi:hypothetical protein
VNDPLRGAEENILDRFIAQDRRAGFTGAARRRIFSKVHEVELCVRLRTESATALMHDVNTN